MVRERNDGDVVIEYKGIAPASRKFVKDARVNQTAIADNKILGPLLECELASVRRVFMCG
jgi:hypothetical protein